jgi:hypothetical protein
MAKALKLQRWAIYVLRNKGELLGSVEAPDAAAAITAAIDKFGITAPERQKRLVARNIGRAGGGRTG